MIKKVSSALALSFFLIAIVFLLNMKYHFMFKSACGSGMAGLKILGIYAAVAAIIFLLWNLIKKREKDISCAYCKTSVEGSWKICPYCGYEIAKEKAMDITKEGIK
ncbi:MAG: hypothetical protein ACOYVK_14825 [Bacillota bacterium]